MLCHDLATDTHRGQMVHCTSAVVGGVGAPCHNTHSCWNDCCTVIGCVSVHVLSVPMQVRSLRKRQCTHTSSCFILSQGCVYQPVYCAALNACPACLSF